MNVNVKFRKSKRGVKCCYVSVDEYGGCINNSKYVVGNIYKMLIVKENYVSVDEYGFKKSEVISEEEESVELVRIVMRKNLEWGYVDYWYKVLVNSEDRCYYSSNMKKLFVYKNRIKIK
jgi:hypothetical protein